MTPVSLRNWRRPDTYSEIVRPPAQEFARDLVGFFPSLLHVDFCIHKAFFVTPVRDYPPQRLDYESVPVAIGLRPPPLANFVRRDEVDLVERRVRLAHQLVAIPSVVLLGRFLDAPGAGVDDHLGALQGQNPGRLCEHQIHAYDGPELSEGRVVHVVGIPISVDWVPSSVDLPLHPENSI